LGGGEGERKRGLSDTASTDWGWARQSRLFALHIGRLERGENPIEKLKNSQRGHKTPKKKPTDRKKGTVPKDSLKQLYDERLTDETNTQNHGKAEGGDLDSE